MRTPSVGSDRRSYRRSSDSIAGDYDVETSTGGGVGSMLPAFLRDLSVPNHRNLYEVMLEMDEDSIVVRSVTPTAASASGRSSDHSRSSSPTIRRKFAWWLRLPPSPSPSVQEDPAMMAREARKRQARLERMRSGAQRALKGLRFISNSTVCGGGESDGLWTTVESRFRSLAKDGLLSRDDFGDCIGMEDSKEFATGVFDALCRRRRQKLERINRDELYDFWLQISNQSFDARLQIFFDMVDTNADGRITRKEVQELITLSASANKLAKLEEQVEEYASLIMEELDPENLGYIELWQLEALLLSRDIYMNYSRPLATPVGWQSQNNSGGGGFPRKKRNLVRRAAYYLHENWRKGWVVALWVTVMAALFAWKFVQYRRSDAFRVMGYCLTTAKGAAETLKLNMALVLLPVCRNTLTWLRSTRAGLFVPFDDNINFHKMIAVGIVAGVALHAGNHLACDFPRLLRAPPEKFRLVANDFGGVTPTYGGLLTGIEGLTGIAMVVLMAVSFTLATKRFRKSLVRLPSPLNRLTGFNAFWYSHHLFVVVYALLLVHGYFMFLVHNWYEKTTWMYLCFPLLVYMGERILRTFRSEAYSARILKVAVLPGSVLSLVMTKPHGFRYKSGQYIFIKCPAVSPFEWHPFSITSAPGDDHLSVHIRTVGDWTEELRRVFTEAGNSSSNIGRAKFDNLGRINQKSLPRLLVDGPYGAAAQDYTNYDVLLLVGLGIGATPFISILRDLLNNRTKADEQNDSTTDMSKSDDSFNSFSFGSTTSSSKKRPQRTTSAHFYWVTREPGSFEWFKGVMDEVAEMDQKGIIEMHNYLTSVYEEGDARSTLLLMVQALNHAKNGVDIVSGTRVRTHFARPNWNDVFSGIASKHPQATIGVFYCGMPVLAKELKRLSHEFSQRTTTRFHFHKEHF
ncbi:hypothetical protein QJS10_CPA09g00044 [Acorus calamus]|uniref:Respiratory burst oxidase-like protein E n=1 Tax=Acorus calamus TaxID=4465 RepID=A0AAV9E3W0_ACOCL|nr:hypothetical protein QJS10_CPA09g00044 [Acorus calamus]